MRALFLLPLLASGCDLSMDRQAAERGQASASRWVGGPARTPPPEGTVAVDQPARDRQEEVEVGPVGDAEPVHVGGELPHHLDRR